MIEYRIGTECGEVLCRRAYNNFGEVYESYVKGKWIPTEDACGVMLGFDPGYSITAEEAEEFIKNHH